MLIKRVTHWRDWHIATKLALLFVVLAIVPLTVVTLRNDASARVEILSATHAQSLQRARGTANTLDNYFAERLNDIRLIAGSPDAVLFLQDAHESYVEAEAAELLRQSRELNGYDTIFITDQSGVVVLATDDRAVGRSFIYSFASRTRHPVLSSRKVGRHRLSLWHERRTNSTGGTNLCGGGCMGRADL